jgi:Domain of unknown function (DUF4326)
MSVVDWHNAPYDVYIGRHVSDGPQDVPAEACVYGNPFILNDVNDPKERAEVIASYEKWLLSPEQASLVKQAREKLPGKVLACWCKPRDCHGDVLLWTVNASDEEIAARKAFLGLT